MTSRKTGAVIAAALATCLAITAAIGLSNERSAAAESPNVLVVITDDEPTGMTKRMPFLDKAEGFTRFRSYYDNNPLCCPARTTLLTGLYSHHTKIETNLVAKRFDADSTLATWLDGAGYETALFGKYLNEYPWRKGAGYIPPGWDEWAAFRDDASYYDYTLITDHGEERYGHAASDYSTDVLADRVVQFITGAQQPFFAVYTPYAPHAPRTPAPRDRHAYEHTRVKLPRNFNRPADGSPPYWKKLRPVTKEEGREVTREQWRTLLAVDDAIKRFIEALREVGALDHTVVVFVSDNGYSLGSHRNLQKDCPYEECVHLPLLIRWPGEQTVGEVKGLVSDIDLAPTIAQITGVSPASRVDGTSLVPLLKGEERSLDRPVLLRHKHYPGTSPSFWGIRTERWMYATYSDGSDELYDMRADPSQLENLAKRRRYRDTVRELSRKIEELRSGRA